jgi:hypothetical protein
MKSKIGDNIVYIEKRHNASGEQVVKILSEQEYQQREHQRIIRRDPLFLHYCVLNAMKEAKEAMKSEEIL